MSSSESYPALPAGEYVVEIMNVGDRGSGTPQGYVEFTLRIFQGPFCGRRLWDRLRLWDRRPGIVAFARARLGTICEAVGAPNPCKYDDVCGIPLLAAVSTRAWGGRLFNNVDGYSRLPTAAPKPSDRSAGEPNKAKEKFIAPQS